MNPVIQRELIEQSRSPSLYRLRIASAAAVILTLVWGVLSWEEMRRSGNMVFGPWGITISEGGFLFGRVQMGLMLVILALAPTLTADAIARERREATLGLLGLTPLSPAAVATGKSAANGLRALTLWMAAVPVLTVPFLMGGLSAQQVIEAVMTQVAALLIGLSSGLVASSLAQQFRRSLALAFAFEVLLLFLVAFLQTVIAAVLVALVFMGGIQSAPVALDRAVGVLFRALSGDVAVPPRLGGVGAPGNEWLTLAFTGLTLLVSVGMVCCGTVLLAARRVKRSWQEQPSRPKAVELQRQLTRPILFPDWIRQRQRARLVKNPLVWIQHRTVASALTRWGWIFVVMVVWMLIATTGGWMGGFSGPISIPLWVAPLIVLGGMAFSAAGGFRAERENGTLELLLVTPLSVNQLVQSRWSAHFREFLLPVALQLYLSSYVEGLWHRAGVDYSRFNWILISSLVGMPAIGLWRGLKARNFVTAVLSTLFWSLVVPPAATLLVFGLMQPGYFLAPAQLGSEGLWFFMATRLDWGVLPAILQVLVSLGAFLAARRELSSRRFVHQSQGSS